VPIDFTIAKNVLLFDGIKKYSEESLCPLQLGNF